MKYLAAALVLLSAAPAFAASYPAMVPLDQYLMDRPAEIAMAKSAAPPAIADKARDFQ